MSHVYTCVRQLPSVIMHPWSSSPCLGVWGSSCRNKRNHGSLASRRLPTITTAGTQGMYSFSSTTVQAANRRAVHAQQRPLEQRRTITESPTTYLGALAARCAAGACLVPAGFFAACCGLPCPLPCTAAAFPGAGFCCCAFPFAFGCAFACC